MAAWLPLGKYQYDLDIFIKGYPCWAGPTRLEDQMKRIGRSSPGNEA
jgi:hypothetical protein